jgi:hypothetical protein
MSFWSSISNKVSSFITDKAQIVKDTYVDIQNHTNSLSEQEQCLETLRAQAKLPWESIANPELAETFKEKILEIHNMQEVFEGSFPPKLTIDFDLRELQFIAEKLIGYDIYLAAFRNDLVPDKLDDDDFWHRVFYQIERIKQDLGIESLLDKP